MAFGAILKNGFFPRFLFCVVFFSWLLLPSLLTSQVKQKKRNTKKPSHIKTKISLFFEFVNNTANYIFLRIKNH